MEKKTARLTVLLDPARKSDFESLCRSQDITPSQVLRQLIREFVLSNSAAKKKPAPKKSIRVRAAS